MIAGVIPQGGRIAATLFFCLTVTGCAVGPDIRLLEEGRAENNALLEHVPFHGQREYQCGPAALAMSLNASGVPVTVDELIPQVYLPGREGSLQPEMLATTRRHDRISFLIEPSLEAMLTEIDAGRPVLILQNLSLPWFPMWHYAVVIGYDLEERQLVLHTGESPAARVGIRRFDNTWARSGRWGMVTLAPGQLPVRADPMRSAESISNFERVAGAAASESAWDSVVERWPGYPTGWFALGNARYANGQVDSAAKAFEHATIVNPDFGAAWLNLALALEELGRATEALEAVSRAAELPGPWQERATQASARMRSPQ